MVVFVHVHEEAFVVLLSVFPGGHPRVLADLVEHTSHNDVLIAGVRGEDQRFHAAVLSNDINVELAGVFVVVFAQVRDGFHVAEVLYDPAVDEEGTDRVSHRGAYEARQRGIVHSRASREPRARSDRILGEIRREDHVVSDMALRASWVSGEWARIAEIGVKSESELVVHDLRGEMERAASTKSERASDLVVDEPGVEPQRAGVEADGALVEDHVVESGHVGSVLAGHFVRDRLYHRLQACVNLSRTCGESLIRAYTRVRICMTADDGTTGLLEITMVSLYYVLLSC